MLTIRPAAEKDAAALLAIYSPYVEETAISFEYEPPTLEEFTGRVRDISSRFPYLVAEEDGEILGYCYAGTFHARRAYDCSVEISIYLRRDCRGKGLGRKLYAAMEQALKQQGIRMMYACIAHAPAEDDPHLANDSERFHAHVGFTQCGHFHGCAVKFGTVYDMVYMEKPLA